MTTLVGTRVRDEKGECGIVTGDVNVSRLRELRIRFDGGSQHDIVLDNIHDLNWDGRGVEFKSSDEELGWIPFIADRKHDLALKGRRTKSRS